MFVDLVDRHFFRQERTQDPDKGAHTAHGSPFLAVAMERQPDDEMLDTAQSDQLGDARGGLFRISARHGLERMSEKAEVVAHGDPDAGGAVVDAEGADPIAHDAMASEQFGGEPVDEFFDLVSLVPIGDEEGVGGLHDDQILDAEEGDRGHPRD